MNNERYPPSLKPSKSHLFCAHRKLSQNRPVIYGGLFFDRQNQQNPSLQSLFQLMLISKTGFPYTFSPPPNPPPLRPSSPSLAASLPSPATSATSSASTALGS
ncbi:hypothetical protein AAC387_Pa02g0008 [Persea americana]